jgi:hypothetical protein
MFSVEIHEQARQSPLRRAAVRARNVTASPGKRLDPTTQRRMRAAYGFDFSKIPIHTDDEAARSAREFNAAAYALGGHVVFGKDRYAPGTTHGDRLLAHELWHAIQQQESLARPTSTPSISGAHDSTEHEAERAAQQAIAVPRTPVAQSFVRAQPLHHGAGSVILRQIETRDVGRGEQSGFARLPQLVQRLNGMSSGVTYGLNGASLTYVVRDGGTPSPFDRTMMSIIDLPAVVPLRLTSRQGLLGSRAAGFNDQVIIDSFQSGYVDIDDLLASTDLGLQTALVHVLTERSTTRDYARRLGTPSLGADFGGGHARGIAAEERLLRDYFDDPTIRALAEPIHAAIGPGSRITVRVYRNSRRDTLQWRMVRGAGANAGVDPSSIRVITRDGRTLSAEEYRDLLDGERIAGQKRRERLGGATEYMQGGRRVPPP